MSENTFEVVCTIDDVELSTSATDGDITGPTLYGPITVAIDNGNEAGYARDLTVTLNLLTKDVSDMTRFTPGTFLRVLLIVHDPGVELEYGVHVFQGIINQVEANQSATRPGYINMIVIGTDNKQRFNQDEITNPLEPYLPMEPNSAHPDREKTGGLWKLEQVTFWDDPGYAFPHTGTKAMGNAWNDVGRQTGLFPHKFGMSVNDPLTGSSNTDLMQQAAKIMNVRCAFENGVGVLQVARFRGSKPWVIDSRFVSSTQSLKMKLYEWVNTWKTRFSRIYSTLDPKTVEEYDGGETYKYGTIPDFNDYSDNIYEIWEVDNSDLWPDKGTFQLSMKQLNEQRAGVIEIQSRRNISEMTVHLAELLRDESSSYVGGFLGDIFNIKNRYPDNPFIPSVEIDGPLPDIATSAQGIVEQATLTITPQRGRPPKGSLDLVLGPGDGAPGNETIDPMANSTSAGAAPTNSQLTTKDIGDAAE